MRFDGSWGGKPLKGECTDDRHPGEFEEGEDKKDRKDGWIQIKKFGFGFGAGDKGEAFESKPDLPDANEKDQKKRADALQKALEAKTKKEKDAKAKAKDKGKEEWGKSGPLNFEKCSFSKSADRLSPVLVQMSHAGGYKIPTVEVEAVRYGGTGEDFKIPFLRLIFTNVYIKSCTLNLAEESPSEDIEFEYDTVRMETLWTDNATGERMPGEPVRVGWDLVGQKAI